jgi:ankyrin repeat protein
MNGAYSHTLHIACINNDINRVRLLINQGVDINLNFMSDYSTALQEACYFNCDPNEMPIRIQIIKELLENGAETETRNITGLSPLHEACYKNHHEFIKILLDYGANPEILNRDNETPLQIACKFNRIDCIKILLKHGAKISSIDYNDIDMNYHENIRNAIFVTLKQKNNIINARFIRNYWKKINDRKQIESGRFTVY